MRSTVRPGVCVLVASLLLAVLGACDATHSQGRTGRAAPAVREPAPAVTSAPANADGDHVGPRKLAHLARCVEVARLALEKSKLSADHSAHQFDEAQVRAEAELDLARTKLENFLDDTLPNRIGKAELELQAVEDESTEAREDLDRLEQARNEQPSADATGDNAIERARRRADRAQRRFELQREEFRAFVETWLPVEQWELELVVREKEQAVQQVRRAREIAAIDQRIAVLNAEAAVTRLEAKIRDAREPQSKGQ